MPSAGDARVAEGEDDVARRDFAHGLVEGIAGFVSVSLGDETQPSIRYCSFRQSP